MIFHSWLLEVDASELDQRLERALLDKNPDGSHDNGTIYLIVKSDILEKGGLYVVEADADKTIEYVKTEVLVKTGIPLAWQGLIFAGKRLNEDFLVRQYKLRTGSVLHMRDELDGGGI